MIFSWSQYDPEPYNPYYAIYSAKIAGFIKLPTLIDTSYSEGVFSNVFCSYNSQNNQTVFSWVDNTVTRNPYYAIYTEPFPPSVAANRLLNAVPFSTLKPQKSVIVKSVSSEN